MNKKAAGGYNLIPIIDNIQVIGRVKFLHA